jgi:hypothetical protein
LSKEKIMKDNVYVLNGESIIHIYESVSIETLRNIVSDLKDPGFGSDHVHAVRLASRILYRRELESIQELDTIVMDVDPYP